MAIESDDSTRKRSQKDSLLVQDNTRQKETLIQDMRQLRLRHLQRPFFKYPILIYDAFNVIRHRPSPNPERKVRHLRLITILYSHYCEKARWALDLLEDDPSTPYYYTEDCHPPGFHYFETVRASKDQASVTPMVIVHETDQVIAKSSDILRKFLPKLYPNKGVFLLEDQYNQEMGAALRVWLYSLVLNDEFWKVLVSVSRYGCGWIETLLFPWMKSGVIRSLRRDLNITPKTVAVSLEMLRSLFDEASQRLETQPYLAGDSFTAADLTFCALASPLLRPPQLGNFQCPETDLPPKVLKVREELLGTKAGQHVLKVYQNHRLSNGQTLVRVRTAPRNRLPWVALIAVTAAIVGLAACVIS